MDYRRMAVDVARKYNLPPNLFLGLIKQESGFNPKARSHAGAMGLTQLMPGTARELGVTDPFDPMQNLDGGARYLRQQLDTFGNPELALAAYNAGPGNVRKYGGIPPFAETQKYVPNVLANAGMVGGASGDTLTGGGDYLFGGDGTNFEASSVPNDDRLTEAVRMNALMQMMPNNPMRRPRNRLDARSFMQPQQPVQPINFLAV